MAIQPIDSSIPLSSRNVGGLGSALEAGREDKRRSKLFDLALESQPDEQRLLKARADTAESAATQAAQQTRQLAELESITRGVNEAQPLLDRALAAEGGGDFSRSINDLAGVLKRRALNVESTGGDSSDTQAVLQMLANGDLQGVQTEFDRIRKINEFRELAAAGGANATQQLPAAVKTFQAFEQLGDPDNPNLPTPAQERFMNTLRAQQQFATVGGVPGTINRQTSEFTPAGTGVDSATLESEVEAAAELEGGKATAKAEAETREIPRTIEIREKSKARVQASLDLPELQDAATIGVQLIDDVISDPNLPAVIGFIQGLNPGLTGSQRATLAKVEQLQGKAFLDAFQTLKGGGQITEREGEAATKAKSRIGDRRTDDASYIEALKELKTLFTANLERARTLAGTFIEGDTATGANGERIIFRNGQWVPL